MEGVNMEKTSAEQGLAGRSPGHEGERIVNSRMGGFENSRIAKKSELNGFARLIPAVLAIAGSVAITSDRGPSGYQPEPDPKRSNVDPAEPARTEPPVRAVMTNPYDQASSKSLWSREEGRLNNGRIHAISTQSKRLRQDVRMEIRTRSEHAQARSSVPDMEAARGLFGREEEEGSVSNRLPETEVWRDWLVPSISMLEEGDISIGPPANAFLDDLELVRDDLGKLVVGRAGEPSTRVRARAGMNLGEHGRVVAVRDTPDAYYLILENGYRVVGQGVSGEEMRSDSASAMEDGVENSR